MGKRRVVSRCSSCGHEEPRWVGRCPACGAWGTMGEEAPVSDPAADASSRTSAPATTVRPARPVLDVPLDEAERVATGIAEFDRVLGGGLVDGMVALLGGAPGVGKSTLLLQAADRLGAGGATVLYAAGEESAGQVRLRAERLGCVSEAVLVAAETSLPDVLGLLDAHEPDLLVLDSVQTVSDPALGSSPGSVVQVRECAAALVRAAKRTGTAVVLVGHVTKEGTLAGPRVLEHMVDTVLSFEGDRHHALRLLRTVKNRFGPAEEVGCFEMAGDGLREVADPSRLFLGEHGDGAPGVAVTVTIEGPRPLALELQALSVDSELASPRRQTTGIDASRLSLLVAVLDRRAGLRLARSDLYASAVGGVRVREPAADLALCLAIASSQRDVAVPDGLVAIGEVGLAGEVRAVPQLQRRLAEAARLGFDTAAVPASYSGDAAGLRLVPVRTVQQAVVGVLPSATVKAAS